MLSKTGFLGGTGLGILDVVNAKRKSRDGETFMKKFTAKMFYKVFSASSGKVKMPENVGNYRLISRRAVDAFKELRETHRFARGLFCWVGFPTTEIEFEREASKPISNLLVVALVPKEALFSTIV